MASPVGSITRAATRIPDEPLRILTCPTHERYQSGLAGVNAVFYLMQADGIKGWNPTYAPLPANHILLNPSRGQLQLPREVEFDLVWSQNRFGQHQLLAQLARECQLPFVTIEHTLPVPEWSAGLRAELGRMRGDIDVFISEFSRDQWGWKPDEARVVHHGIDTERFSPAPLLVRKQPVVLSVVNDWKNRDWCCGFNLWKDIVRDDLPTVVVGDTPGLSKPAASIHELVLRYREADVFLNTSLVSPVPTALLEAMACGCAVVSSATAMIPEVIEHGVNGLISNSPDELRQHVQELLRDGELRQRLGEAARQTILARFSMESFVNNWTNVFREASKTVFKG